MQQRRERITEYEGKRKNNRKVKKKKKKIQKIMKMIERNKIERK